MPNVHDSHCGIKGAFWDSCQKLLNWKQAGARVAAKYFPQEKLFDNINELKSILYEFRIPLFVCVWWAPLQFNRYRKGFEPLSAKKAVEIMKEQNLFHKYSYDMQRPPCIAGWRRVFISSNFLLKACHVTEKSIADLTKQRFIDIWNQDSYWGKWRSIQFKDLQECSNCQYQKFCHVCPSPLIEHNYRICNLGKLEWAKSMYESINC
jgi:radical SAM protein with 4Fe4S-binding SPASM domain